MIGHPDFFAIAGFYVTMPHKRHESTLLHTYVLNEFLTDDR